MPLCQEPVGGERQDVLMITVAVVGGHLLDVAVGAGRTLRAAEFAAARYISCPFVRIACRSGPGI